MQGNADSAVAVMWEEGKCIDCGYALRGLVGSRCPECGREFDRNNASTFNLGRHCGPVARWLLGPTRWLAKISPWAFGFVIVAQTYYFLQVYVTVLDLALVWLILAGPYLFWSGIRALVRSAYKQPVPSIDSDLLARKRVSRNVLIATAVVFTRIPMLVPFWISEPSLNRYANHLYTEVPMLSQPTIQDRRCGLYSVSVTSIGPTGVWMQVGNVSMMYAPDAEFDNQTHLLHLSGNWYTFDQLYSINR